MPSMVDLNKRRICSDDSCGWTGPETECVMCGAVGPLCPICGETTEVLLHEKKTCPVCGGDDERQPCAYPGDGKAGCLRDERLRSFDKKMAWLCG